MVKRTKKMDGKLTAYMNMVGKKGGYVDKAGDIEIPVMPLVTGIPLMLDVEPVGGPAAAADFLAKRVQEYGEEVIKEQMDDIAMQLRVALDAAIEAPVWSFPGGARDIVDTGKLKASALVSVSGLGISVSYGAPYAMLVHNGGYIFPYGNKKARPIYLPPRPWIRSVLYGGGPVPKFDFAEAIRQAFR